MPSSSCVAFEPQEVNASVCFNCTDVPAVMAKCCPLRSTPPVCSACKRPQERSSEQPYIPCWGAPTSDLGSSEKHHCASPVKPGDSSRTTPFGTWKLDVYVQPERKRWAAFPGTMLDVRDHPESSSTILCTAWGTLSCTYSTPHVKTFLTRRGPSFLVLDS